MTRQKCTQPRRGDPTETRVSLTSRRGRAWESKRRVTASKTASPVTVPELVPYAFASSGSCDIRSDCKIQGLH